MLQAVVLRQQSVSASSPPLLLYSSRVSSASANICSKCHHLSSTTLHQQRLYYQTRRRPLHNPVRFSQRAGKSQMSEVPASSKEIDEELDDDELDAAFKEHGEVVIADTNPLPASSEVDDDSQSLALAVALAEAANDTKAVDILVLHVKPLVYWTRFFVIATAFSRPQLAAIAKKMRDIGVERFAIQARGDSKPTSWTLLDYGDVVAHVFLPKERAFYNLEEFYGNAPVVELPFNASASAESSE